jgi:DNA-binding transcriptional regulator PaaX
MRDGVPKHSETRWLLLIHAIPPKPNYLRVKIGRRLQRLGAVAIKNSVYALPKNDEAHEDFQWVAREIVEGEGDASIVEARFVDGLSDAQIEALFQSARED